MKKYLFVPLMLLVLACASAPPAATATPPGVPDARVAVNARSAIDSVESLRVAVCVLAVSEHQAGHLADAKYEKVKLGCNVVAQAEDAANAQLAVYIATGSLDAQKALTDALIAVTTSWAQLDAERKAGG